MYIEFTEEQKRQANETDLVSLLERNGQQVKRVGSEYEWKDGGQTVSIKDNLWFHQYEQVGGTTIGFVRKFWGLSYPEAVQFILGEEIQNEGIKTRSNADSARIRETNASFQLPERNENHNRVFAYLINTRGIDRNVVRMCVHEGLIYESKGYHNAVFVGKDKDGVPRHAHKRSTAKEKVWRANERGSDSRFSFNWRGKSDRVFLFEAPIDMLSYISMYCPNWQEDNFLAACSISDNALNQFLEDRPDVRQVYICFDNDPPGQKAAAYLKQKLYAKGINCEILVPSLKDWNEDLLNSVQEEGEVKCLTESRFL